jgi:hypothetical protein
VATEQEIRQFCQERMADYKLPRKIIFADSLANLEFLRGNRNEAHGIDNRKNEE